MSTLVFFPWLKIDGIMKFGDFILIPYFRGIGESDYNAVQRESIDKILASYISVGERPIDKATLLRIDSKDIFRDLSNDESNAIFAFSELLAISALCERSYFSSEFNYCNRDLFQVVLQSFQDPGSGVTRITRRRDGHNISYLSHGVYHLHKPDHVSIPLRLEINEHLLKALISAQNDMPVKKWTAIFEAIFNFNHANTDSDAISTQAEAVFMISAFERLLVVSGNENKLAKLFSAQFPPDRDKHPTQCQRLNDPVLLRRFRHSNTIRDIWIRDFFRLRGEVSHGIIGSKYSSVWSLNDHLLLASFAFPLLLKCILGKSGYYELTWIDKAFINAFEELTFEEHIIDGGFEEDEKEWPWNKIIENALFNNVFKKKQG